jgi:hypothetical protein
MNSRKANSDYSEKGPAAALVGQSQQFIIGTIPQFLEVFVRKCLIACIFSSLLITSASAQTQDPFPTGSQEPQFGREKPRDPIEEKMEHDREKALNKQRQTNLQKDTDRLLKLATELKEYVDKSNEHTLSLDVIKKADEIEKLAKSVKDRMKGSY